MLVFRIFMVVILTLSASLSGAMDAGHMHVPDHDHVAAEVASDDQPACCQDGAEHTQTCHALTALLPVAEPSGPAPLAGEDAFCTSGMLLIGMDPSAPLDPPRAV